MHLLCNILDNKCVKVSLTFIDLLVTKRCIIYIKISFSTFFLKICKINAADETGVKEFQVWFRQLIFPDIIIDFNEERSEEMCHDSQCIKKIHFAKSRVSLAHIWHIHAYTYVHKLAEKQAWSPLNLAFQETEGGEREKIEKKDAYKET